MPFAVLLGINVAVNVKPLAIGLNCSLGPDLMRPFLAELAQKSDTAISCYPNAGLPNSLSPTGFDLRPEDMGRSLRDERHDGMPAVMLHCSTHSYRMAQTDEWRKCIGQSSYSHEKARDLHVVTIQPERGDEVIGFKWRLLVERNC